MKKLIFTLLVLLTATSRSFGIAPIIGPHQDFCLGATYTFTDSTPGGRWRSLDTAGVVIDSVSGFARVVGYGSHWSGIIAISYRVGTDSTIYYGGLGDIAGGLTAPSTICAGSSIGVSIIPQYSYEFIGYLRTWSSSSSAVAVTGLPGYETTVTGISPGTAVITYNVSATCQLTTTVTVIPSSCTGTPVAGTASDVFSGTCPGQPDTLLLAGHTSCGTALQWQSSPDGSTWADLSGLISAKCHYSPLGSVYYRCKVTCATSGLYAYSNTIYAAHHNLISSHSVITTDTSCSLVHFCLQACAISNTLNATTFYGDGTSDNLPATVGACNASFEHVYALPGTYTIEQILYQGTTPQDSISYSYNYVPCFVFPVNFYYDANSNCQFDSGDLVNAFPITAEVDSNGIAVATISATSGFFYKGFAPLGTVYRFRVISSGVSVTCPSSGTIQDTVLAGNSHYAASFFGLHCAPSGMDLAISSSRICGRHISGGTITASNHFCIPQDATVTMYFSPKYLFLNADPMPTSVVGNKVVWVLPSLSGLGTPFNINYQLQIPYPYDSRTWLIPGDTIQTDVTITPFVGDTDTTNNRNKCVDTVKSSYDPNGMLVSPTGHILSCTPLQYTIYFENTGNDTAHNIYVLDTLPDYVDINSLRIVAASAEVMNTYYYKTPDGHNAVKFDFPRINLLDSSHANQCRGMVVFTIKVKNGLADGLSINNRAGIYFDDNAVVMTNEVANTTGMPPITGPDILCLSDEATYVCDIQGGIWHMANPKATVNGGLVTAIGQGLDTVTYTVANSCTSRASTKAISINGAAPSVGISSSIAPGDSACAGTPVTFTAVPINAGTAPSYIWWVNGVLADSAATYTYMPANKDVVKVKLGTNSSCAAQPVSTDTVAVFTPLQPSVTIGAQSGLKLVAGMSETLTAIVTNGGASPYYQWSVNGAAVAGATSSSYVTGAVTTTDTFSCTITSRECVGLKATATAVVPVVKASAPSLLPNPNKGAFHLYGTIGMASGAAQVQLDIKDAIGQLAYKTTITVNNSMLDANIQLPPGIARGMYLLTLYTPSGRQVLHFAVE